MRTGELLKLLKEIKKDATLENLYWWANYSIADEWTDMGTKDLARQLSEADLKGIRNEPDMDEWIEETYEEYIEEGYRHKQIQEDLKSFFT
jgi:hypothetical protein